MQTQRIVFYTLFWLAWLIPGVGFADPPLCSDTITTEIIGSSLFIHHYGAEYNCCPEFEFTCSDRADSLFVRLTEVSATCDCTCCQNLTTEISVPPGDYHLVYSWFDHSDGWRDWTQSVRIPDNGQN
ncbi:MAG: hypothetical protein ABIF77_00180, partial [bacterium]